MVTTYQRELAREAREAADGYRRDRDQYLAEARAAQTPKDRRDALANASEYAGYVRAYTYNALEYEGNRGEAIERSAEYALESGISDAIDAAWTAASKEALRAECDREVCRLLRALRTEQDRTAREILYNDLAYAYDGSSTPQHADAARRTSSRLRAVRQHFERRAA